MSEILNILNMDTLNLIQNELDHSDVYDEAKSVKYSCDDCSNGSCSGHCYGMCD